MSFGNKIKTLRKQANMTQEGLAELLSISPQAVSRWETDVAMPDISLLPHLQIYLMLQLIIYWGWILILRI